MKILKATVLLLPLIFTTNLYSQCNSQNTIEKGIHDLTVEYRYKIINDENAIRKIRLISEWYEKIKLVTCIPNSISFEALVWSVDFNPEKSNYILRLATKNEIVPIPIFYNYDFNENNSLINKLSELDKRNKVKFKFVFRDTFFPDSSSNDKNYDNYRGFPVEENPDTGNLIYMLFIELIDIEVID